MGQNGRRWMQDEFNWNTIAQRFLTVYDTMIHDGEATIEPFVHAGKST